jgi:hypothetical protein
MSARHPLLQVIDRAEPVETPDAPPGFCNRFVKTRMRQVLDGDFVYFDADTLVMDRIDEMLSCPAPMAGVADCGVPVDQSGIDIFSRSVFESMNWQLPRRTFINGGVLLLRDCEPTRRFGVLWHDKWLAWSRLGRHTDQQALNSALTDSGIDYSVLDYRFNGQLNGRPSICRGPVSVWHFYASQSDRHLDVPRTVQDEAIARFRAQGRLTPDVINELRRWPYPWQTPTVLDRWFVRRFVLCKDNLSGDCIARYWLAGHRRKAVMKYLRWRVLEQTRYRWVRYSTHRVEAVGKSL